MVLRVFPGRIPGYDLALQPHRGRQDQTRYIEPLDELRGEVPVRVSSTLTHEAMKQEFDRGVNHKLCTAILDKIADVSRTPQLNVHGNFLSCPVVAGHRTRHAICALSVSLSMEINGKTHLSTYSSKQSEHDVS